MGGYPNPIEISTFFSWLVLMVGVKPTQGERWNSVVGVFVKVAKRNAKRKHVAKVPEADKIIWCKMHSTLTQK